MELSLLVLVQLTLIGCTQAVETLTTRVVDGVTGQQSPCLGQDVIHTCTFPSGQTMVDMIVRSEGGDEAPLTLTFGTRPMRNGSILGNVLIANLTSSTSAELLIMGINSALNRSTVTCEVLGLNPPRRSLTVFVLGSASGPIYAFDLITQSNFESINVTVQRPNYGWECVDTYAVIAQSSAGDVLGVRFNVTAPEQPMTVVPLVGLDLCRNTYSLTTFATSNGDRGQNFTLQGPYPTNSNVLSNVDINVSDGLPLIVRLSWNLESTPQPPDCVSNYSLSFNGNRFVTSNTSVLPNELLDNYVFPFCTNQPLKISPIIPALGDIDTSSRTVMIRVEEGFQAAQEVTLSMFKLYFDDTTLQLRFGFRLDWTTFGEVNASVGFATGSQTCISSSSSSSRSFHTFSSLDPQLFVGVPFRGCVRLQKIDCTSTNESMEVNAPIAINASSLLSRGRDRFETRIRRNSDFVVDSLLVTITPDNAQFSVAANGDVFTVTFFGLKDDTTYSVFIQAQNVDGDPVGIPINGTLRTVPPPPPPPPPPYWVVGVICAVLLIIVIIAVVLLIKYRYVICRWCHHHGVCECCSCSEVEETDTHELKSQTDHSSAEHEQTPEYAVVDKTKKSKKVKDTKSPAVIDTLYQDPSSIQHETAPTGDVYAVTEKKPKKKGPTEAELVGMYSVPDKTKGAGLTYASLDIPGGGGSEAPQQPAPTEYATVIN